MESNNVEQTDQITELPPIATPARPHVVEIVNRVMTRLGIGELSHDISGVFLQALIDEVSYHVRQESRGEIRDGIELSTAITSRVFPGVNVRVTY